ncbi:MAG: S1 RNA-binding domain-containing protein [Planctomycetes bacterium]|nr:S1 RNA-binding domain-containing protein [Planctomycetota bacterium]
MTESSSSSPTPLDAQLEKEIADALGDQTIEELMQADAPPRKSAAVPEDEADPRARFGTVAGIRDNEVYVEFSAKEQGVCALDQFHKKPRVGDRIEFIVDSVIPGEGLLRLLIPGGAGKADWKTLAKDQIIDAMVVGMNTGGLELKVANQRAFMPVSQIELGRVEDLTPYVNKKLRCKVMELDRKRKRIVLSRRAVLEVEEAANRKELVKTIQIGETREGVVRRVQNFGAFVELVPGVDGLVHVSDISYQRIENPADVLSVGQKVTVKVLKVSEEGDRISLSIKEAGPDPWQGIEARYAQGADLTGTVTRLAAFGAFVELEPGVEGLIHISQLSDQRVDRVEQAVKVGQQVTARITEVDPRKHRIGLSIRALTAKDVHNTTETTSKEDLAKYVVKDTKKARTGESLGALLSKFSNSSGQKGGIG